MSRAVRSLLILTALVIMAVGMAAQALVAPAGVAADIQLGGSVLVLAASATLLVRVLRRISPPVRRHRSRRRRSRRRSPSITNEHGH